MFATIHGTPRLVLSIGLIVILNTAAAWAQQPPPVDRKRGDAGQPEVRQPGEPGERQQRQGGILRSHIQPERQQPGEEGLADGVPALRRREGDLRAPSLQLQPGGADWKLGVYARNTETGVVVTRVVPDSAAARQGLERGDRIVAVQGYQVGYVGDYLFPLGHELQRNASRRGAVALLVQNVRNGDLLVLQVQLTRGGFD